MEEVRLKKALGAVDKFRIRKKWPPPATIWDGEPIKKGYKVRSRDIMKNFYEDNKYPSLNQRRILAQKTGLNVDQVKNWFKNRRKRENDKQLAITGGSGERPIKPATVEYRLADGSERLVNLPALTNDAPDDGNMTIHVQDEDDPDVKPEPIDPDDQLIIQTIQ